MNIPNWLTIKAYFKKNRIYKNFPFVTTIILLTGQICFGQENNVNQNIHNADESFLKLPDGVMKKEIAFFNIKGSSSIDSFPKITINEIPLKRCSDSFAFFEKGNIYAIDINIYIQSESIATKSRIKKVFYIHYKYGFSLPDSAIKDIYDPVFCLSYSKRNKPISSDCKVFQSEDKRRIYIYMVNSHGVAKYEVIWVIEDEKYYTRIIDSII